MDAQQFNEPSVQQLFDLRGSVSLVTGGGGHLGKSLARALAEAGSRVVVTSRSAQRAAEVATQLPAVEGGSHEAVVLDHMDEQSIQRAVGDTIARCGRIDVLVANAHEATEHDWRRLTGDEFTRQLANATGYFLLARQVRDHAIERGDGASIILLGSMYALVGSYPDVYEGIDAASSAAYHALKGGIVQLARHLAVYWAGDGVRVNCLSPGPFPSPAALDELCRRLEQKSPMHRMGQPHELKGAVVFLASRASSYMTGQNLIIDGGWTAW